MRARGAASLLRERIGHEATDALSIMMEESGRSMAEQVVRETGNRFERRLTEEVSGLKTCIHEGFAGLRIEVAGVRVEIIRWSFLFWAGQLGAIAALLAYMM